MRKCVTFDEWSVQTAVAMKALVKMTLFGILSIARSILGKLDRKVILYYYLFRLLLVYRKGFELI